MPKRKDITGQRFGRLVVIKCAGKGKHGYDWLCKCDCGNEKIVNGGNLRTGNTTSCGCYFREPQNHRNNVKHSGVGTKLYSVWIGLRRRCREQKGCHFTRYAGRGIAVCKEWENFENFYNWAINNGYSENLTIDRIDNDKGYSPDNCRWATLKQQANNKCNNKFYVFNGERLTLAQIADKYNIKYDTLHKRVKTQKWDIEKAITTPISIKHNSYKNKKNEV